MRNFYKKSGVAGAAIFAGFFILINGASAQSAVLEGAIAITEIGNFETADYEWVEIFNSGGEAIDLTGWKFYEDQTNHGLAVFRGSAALEPSAYAIIANKPDLFAQKYPEYLGAIFDSSWSSLKEDGEEIGLKNSSGEFIEQFSYPGADVIAGASEAGAAPDSAISVERIDAAAAGNDAANWRFGNPHTIGGPAISQTAGTTETVEMTGGAAAQEENVNPATETPTATETETITDGTATAIDAAAQETNAAVTQTEISGAAGAVTGVSGGGSNGGSGGTGASAGSAKTARTTKKSTAKTASAVELFSGLPLTTLNIKGYFVFVPEGAVKLGSVKNTKSAPAAAKKSVKKKKSSATKKATIKKTVSAAGASSANKNGGLSSTIRITELLPRPDETDEEWIELFNSGDGAVNLGNWTLADSGKSANPYLIADSIALQPGEFTVLKKSETKIALNNDGDTVTLSDFAGNEISRVEYSSSRPGESYALIDIKDKTRNKVASLTPVAPRENEETWQWTDSPTPGKENPKFEKLEGIILASSGTSSFTLTQANGERATVYFSPETLDPLLASAVLAPGVSATLLVKNDKNGYKLQHIQRIIAAEEKESAGGGVRIFIWLGVIAAASALGAASIILWHKYHLARNHNEIFGRLETIV